VGPTIVGAYTTVSTHGLVYRVLQHSAISILSIVSCSHSSLQPLSIFSYLFVCAFTLQAARALKPVPAATIVPLAASPMAAGDIPSLSLFPVLRAAVDCRLVVSATETVFGSGHDLRLFVSPPGTPCSVIPFSLLQRGSKTKSFSIERPISPETAEKWPLPGPHGPN
jgi:hypothetical protein